MGSRHKGNDALNSIARVVGKPNSHVRGPRLFTFQGAFDLSVQGWVCPSALLLFNRILLFVVSLVDADAIDGGCSLLHGDLNGVTDRMPSGCMTTHDKVPAILVSDIFLVAVDVFVWFVVQQTQLALQHDRHRPDHKLLLGLMQGSVKMCVIFFHLEVKIKTDVRDVIQPSVETLQRKQ